MDTKEMIAVMQAFMEGKKIEFRERGSRTWKPDENPEWDWSGIEYRVAPEPKKDGRWERREIRIDDGDYVIVWPEEEWVHLSRVNAIPGFGGIDYQSPFDPKIIVRSMMPLCYSPDGDWTFITNEHDRPGIPVAVWFWREERSDED